MINHSAHQKHGRQSFSSILFHQLWPLMVFAVFVYGLVRCGAAKPTGSPDSQVEGLPADWLGTSDYQASDWRFEDP